MEIDAVGTFTMSRAAFEALKQNSESVIINISATLHYGATWYQVHASAAKAAVDSITRSLALEWGEYGIRVNGVAPGPIRGTAGEAVCGRTVAGECWGRRACLRSKYV
jgi:peroxisomal 2,4-dienoyl-CoA reductase